MSSQPSAQIDQYADYLNVADVAAALDGIDDESVESAIKSMSAEMSYRLGVSIRALMEATSDTTSDISPYIYREPMPSQNIRVFNVSSSVTDVETKPTRAAARIVLQMATLDSKRRFLEE